MAIRYNKEFNAEIQKIVKNFNAKVDRLERQEQEIRPEKTSVSELKKVYQNRRQLKRKLRQLQSFSRRGAEKVFITPGGVEMTEWEYETGRADYIMVKRRIAKQVRIETPKTPSPYLKKERLQNAEDRLSEMQKSFKDLSLKELQRAQSTINLEINRRLKEDIFKNNLLKRLGSALESRGYDPNILNRFREFTGEELLMIYNNEAELEDVMNFSDTLTELLETTEMTSRDGKLKITSTQFDKILNRLVSRLPYYEKTYKK